MDRIMLRFRPIAPKPATAPGGVDPTDPSSSCHVSRKLTAGRGRRKAATTNGNTTRRKRKPLSPDRTAQIGCPDHYDDDDQRAVAVTLPLLPEAPDLTPTSGFQDTPKVEVNYGHHHHRADRTAETAPRAGDLRTGAVFGSWVTVEAITDTWPDVRRLDDDTCPGFLTDAWHRVVWANAAYRRMVLGEEDTWREDVRLAVWVVMRERVPDSVQAFTCRVRVQGGFGVGEGRGSQPPITLPCDAWRVEGGGFAWRLDVDAALSLGR